MTEDQKRVLARARREPPRFVVADPSRVTRFTAYDNHMRKRAAEAERRVSDLLEAELKRLANTWSKP